MTPAEDRVLRLRALGAQMREYLDDADLIDGRESASRKAFAIRLRLVAEADLEREERGRRVWYRLRAAEARELEARLGTGYGETAANY